MTQVFNRFFNSFTDFCLNLLPIKNYKAMNEVMQILGRRSFGSPTIFFILSRGVFGSYLKQNRIKNQSTICLNLHLGISYYCWKVLLLVLALPLLLFPCTGGLPHAVAIKATVATRHSPILAVCFQLISCLIHHSNVGLKRHKTSNRHHAMTEPRRSDAGSP